LKIGIFSALADRIIISAKLFSFAGNHRTFAADRTLSHIFKLIE